MIGQVPLLFQFFYAQVRESPRTRSVFPEFSSAPAFAARFKNVLVISEKNREGEQEEILGKD